MEPRLFCTQRAKVEYFSPVRRANWGSDSLLRDNAARISRRCAFDTRNLPLVSAVTGNLGAAAGASEKLSEPLAVIIALRTMIIVRL